MSELIYGLRFYDMKHLKEEFDKLSFKEFLTYVTAILSAVAAVVAVFLSLYIPPEGEIHTSVLTYFSISAGFCSLLLGISNHYGVEMQKFKNGVNDYMSKMGLPVTVPQPPGDRMARAGGGAAVGGNVSYDSVDDMSLADEAADGAGVNALCSGDVACGDAAGGDFAGGKERRFNENGKRVINFEK